MFSVIPGFHDSDVSSDSEPDKSSSESCDDKKNSVSLKTTTSNFNTVAGAVSVNRLPIPAEAREGDDDEHHEKPGTCSNLDENDVQSERVPPAGISHQTWEKFQSLQQRRSDTKLVKDATTYGTHKKRRRRKRKKDQVNDNKTVQGNQEVFGSSEPSSDSGSTSSNQQQNEHWGTLKKYLNVNDHMKGVDHGKYAPKSGMEKKLDEAVAAGDFEKAEDISNDLSKRELACKIAKAANARDYLAWKHEQEERREANRKKRRKLAWGFEPKERWQMKGNM